MIRLSLEINDVREVASDLLLLKYAEGFHGADEAVALSLSRADVCSTADIRPPAGEHALVEVDGAMGPQQVLFIGTGRLGDFRYKQMRQFARLAADVIRTRGLAPKLITTTVHGVGYGLDLEESLQALVFGFQQGFGAWPNCPVREIRFVERNRRRAEALAAALDELNAVTVPGSWDDDGESTSEPGAESGVDKPPPPRDKQCVFVAMPFAEDFEDVYRFGIYAAVRSLGYVCERVDESSFAGNIVDRIIDGIRRAEFIVADLTLERPNVYLEVGYAWGIGKPVILVAREGQHLHFDLSQHKCLFYRTIGQLTDSLTTLISDAFPNESQ